MKHENAKQLWKRRLSMGLSLAMAVTMLPVGGLSANAEEGDAPALLKARSTSGVEGSTYTRNQPFIANVTGTTEDGAGRPYFGAPAFTVFERLAFREDGEDCTYWEAETNSTMLITAAEGKFDEEKLAGGTDIVASVSKDGGKTWTYSYPLRFPDSEGNAGAYATSINRPSLVTDKDGKIYCLMNVTPTGVSSFAKGEGFTFPKQGTGYIDVNGTKRLALTDSTTVADQSPADGNYSFYVGDFDDTTELAKVLKVADDTETVWAVDKWFNLYSKEGDSYEPLTQKRATSTGYNNAADYVQQNLFYKASTLHVYNTSYLVCVTSENGLDWSAPEMLNPHVKRDDGYSLAVSSGKALRTSANRLVFPVFRNDETGDKNGEASVIWLDKSANGDNEWHRSEAVPKFEQEEGETENNNWVGDGEIVELSDGNLRYVFRNGKGLISYADAKRNADNVFEFSSPVSTGTRSPEGANPSVISYLNPIDERKGLLIASPVGENLDSGRIMTFLKTEDGVEGEDSTGGMTRVEGFDIPGTADYFRNACLDQMNAGSSVGLV